MRPQVVALFDHEYGTGEETFNSLFGAFYEHPFQADKCIRIVALDDKKVAGFQSFFYWPVKDHGKELAAYQSGNSLVHPEYRGKGLFAKMLNFIHEPGSGFDAELLIGFPVEASYGSFMKNKWHNPFNLQWYVKTLNPLASLISNPEDQLQKAWGVRHAQDFEFSDEIAGVCQKKSFDQYRINYQSGKFFRFIFEKEGNHAFFELKAQRRKKIIKEIVIGKILLSIPDETFLKDALNALLIEIKKQAGFTMISVAVNNKSLVQQRVLAKLGFKAIEKKIYFIAKGARADKIQNWEDWWMFRGDIDTW